MSKYKKKLFSVLGVPVYIHATSVLVLAYFIIAKGFLPGLVATIAFFILMFIHEIGHAFFVRYYKHELDSISLYPLHGICEYYIDERYLPETLIIAGGLIFQAAVGLIWYALIAVLSLLKLNSVISLIEPLTYIFLSINLLAIVINLLPIKGLDGHELWRRLFYAINGKVFRFRQKLKQKKRDAQPSPQKVVDIAIAKAKKKR